MATTRHTARLFGGNVAFRLRRSGHVAQDGRRDVGALRVDGERGSTLVRGLLTAIVVVLAVGLGAKGWGMTGWADELPPDDPLAYSFMRTKERTRQPVVWDPCLPVQIVVNKESAPPEADVLLTEAVSRVREATGLELEVVGTTTEQPDPERTQRELRSGRPGAARAPVLFAWTSPDVVPRLKGSVAGMGGPVTQFGNASDRTRYIGGVVYLDSPQVAAALRGRDGHARARAIVMHELGHLVGLDHVDNDSQLMAPRLHRGVTEFGMGDRAGLRQLGSGGCPYSVN